MLFFSFSPSRLASIPGLFHSLGTRLRTFSAQLLSPVEVKALHSGHNIAPGRRVVEVTPQEVLPRGCGGLAIDEGCVRSGTTVWPPHSVCPGWRKFTCEAIDVAIVRAPENNVILKRIDGTL